MRRSGPKAWWAAAIAIVLVAESAAATAEHGSVQVAPWGSVRMGLGLPAERWNSEGAPAPRQHQRSQCSRWRAAAARLGETYAGHLLRQTVIRRECRFLEADRLEEIWDWPWASLSGGRIMPPRLHASFGDWEIRCGAAGARRRCALLHRSPLWSDHDLDSAGQSIVTHFVIDTVARRESLLWRLFVPQAEVDAPAPEKARSYGVVLYRLDRGERKERFPACTAAGCLMEANIRHAADVATHLWDGRSLPLEVQLQSDPPLTLTLPAEGFRAGLKELVRLRREEARATGRR